MTNARPDDPSAERSLRLWPGVVLAVLMWLGRFVIPAIWPDAVLWASIGGLLAGPGILVWWVFFSRASRLERWAAPFLIVAAMAATKPFLHRSVAEGNVGMQYFIWAIPVVGLAFVVWAAASRRLAYRTRLATMVATVLVASGAFILLRSDGLTGDGSAQFALRWSSTAEERLLAEETYEPAAPASRGAVAETGASWPGFRGPARDGTVSGVRLETDWSTSPPVELWQRGIGPGVSSISVYGELLYTQEQRGENEIVASYRVSTGEPVWRYAQPARFWDAYVGAGPRSTPAVADGRVYAFGTSGTLHALDAFDGTLVWSRDVAADTDSKVPGFGFASSPLVVDDMVIMNAKNLVAYDRATGERRWLGPAAGSYASPQLMTIDGEPQIVHAGADRVMGVAPADGTLLWEASWPGGGGIVQPALTADGDVLVAMDNAASAMPMGTRRWSVARGPGGWTATERWASEAFRPSFSQFVVHGDYVYGFDNRIFACVDAEDGQRKWKRGRYGAGQVLLLPDQDLLLVISERGKVALVSAEPDGFTELATFRAIEGKAWSQPTLVGDVLLVRNGKSMAAYRLPLQGA